MSFKEGIITEESFRKLVETHFLSITKSSDDEDMNDHVDFTIPIKIDVKGLKKINRSDENVQDDYHFVEIKNVNGDNGWLYGQATYFAFELFEYFIFVDKEKLQKHIAEKVKKEHVQFPKDAVYKLYQRDGRKDLMTLIPTKDLLLLSDLKHKK